MTFAICASEASPWRL